MIDFTRRQFLRAGFAGAAGAAIGLRAFPSVAQAPGDRPSQASAVKVLNPAGRVPVSLIIDDSTCLVNLAHFAIPQFAEVFPDRYLQDWKKLPREIPDSFVRRFAEWSHERGIKGKYSIVPYPACVGWIDRDMPGWSRRELTESLELVRTHIVPDWDIHPEMVTHTWIIDTKTGRPYPERSERFMENWRWTDGRSTDELADYMAYALRPLKNVGLPCEGITTPGGFGNRVLPQLAEATLHACRDVFQTEIPHYFRHLYTDDRSVAPLVELASNLDGHDPRCVVSIIGCTGDWFGNWDGLEIGTVDQFITKDLKGGRLPQVIDRGEPAVLVCHWPGIYCNGDETGFDIFKQVVERLHARYDNLRWMKNSEIARYWAAKELTRIDHEEHKIVLDAPFAAPLFTIQFEARADAVPKLRIAGKEQPLTEAAAPLKLSSGSWVKDKERITVCFDLPRGESVVEW